MYDKISIYTAKVLYDFNSHKAQHTVYPKKYAHGFCFAVLCCGYTLTDFPISIRLTSLALWQSSDCPSASKATLMNMDKYFIIMNDCITTTKQSTTEPCAYFLGYTVHSTITWEHSRRLGVNWYRHSWKHYILNCRCSKHEYWGINNRWRIGGWVIAIFGGGLMTSNIKLFDQMRFEYHAWVCVKTAWSMTHKINYPHHGAISNHYNPLNAFFAK